MIFFLLLLLLFYITVIFSCKIVFFSVVGEEIENGNIGPRRVQIIQESTGFFAFPPLLRDLLKFFVFVIYKIYEKFHILPVLPYFSTYEEKITEFFAFIYNDTLFHLKNPHLTQEF